MWWRAALWRCDPLGCPLWASIVQAEGDAEGSGGASGNEDQGQAEEHGRGLLVLSFAVESAQVGAERQAAVDERKAAVSIAVRSVLAAAFGAVTGGELGVSHAEAGFLETLFGHGKTSLCCVS